MIWTPVQPGEPLADPRLTRIIWATAEFLPPGSPLDFDPDYTPVQLESLGVFGRAYFGGDGETRRHLIQCYAETCGFPYPPPTPFTNHRGSQCKKQNYFGRPASLDRDWWLDRQLIDVTDPLGWYEWFWWYWLGRRIPPVDDWQIGRWRNFKVRHTAMYRARPQAGQAQALLHWGIRAPDLC